MRLGFITIHQRAR